MQWPRLLGSIQTIMVRVMPATLLDSTKRSIADLEHSMAVIWPDLLGALFEASQSSDAGQREGAFRIFAQTPGIIDKQHEDTVLTVFTKGFKDDDVSVRWLHVVAVGLS